MKFLNHNEAKFWEKLVSTTLPRILSADPSSDFVEQFKRMYEIADGLVLRRRERAVIIEK